MNIFLMAEFAGNVVTFSYPANVLLRQANKRFLFGSKNVNAEVNYVKNVNNGQLQLTVLSIDGTNYELKGATLYLYTL